MDPKEPQIEEQRIEGRKAGDPLRGARMDPKEQRIRADKGEAVVEDTAVEVHDDTGRTTVEVHAGTRDLKEMEASTTALEMDTNAEVLDDEQQSQAEHDKIAQAAEEHRLRGGEEDREVEV